MPSDKPNNQGCHWSGKGQGKVREFQNCQGNLRKVREI